MSCLTASYEITRGSLRATHEINRGQLLTVLDVDYGPLQTALEIDHGLLQTELTISRGNLQGRVGFVCGTSFTTPEGYKVLWVRDGMLLTINGGRLYVKITG